MAAAVKSVKTAKGAKKTKYVIDAAEAATDKILAVADLATFLSKAIKVDGKAGALAGKVEVKAEGNKVTVETSVPYAKRYFKYLAKKYLKKQQLSEYLRVVANSKTGYQLRYFKINDEETE